MKIERECTGYVYTCEDDNDRSKWSVETDYKNVLIYVTDPAEDCDLEGFVAFGKAIVTAAKDMKREMKDNRFAV